MKLLNRLFILSLLFLLSSCSYFNCGYTPSVRLVDKLPCRSCVYKGVIRPNLQCPDEIYPYKLQCAALKHDANVVVLQRADNKVPFAYPVYRCPKLCPQKVPSNAKTDISNCCDCMPMR